MTERNDRIELSLPFKAEYVSVARLTVSGIASRMGFDIETIEDIKVAVAEVCSKIVSLGSKEAVCFKVEFLVSEKKLTVLFECEDKSLKCIFGSGEDELAISIIQALMDDVELCSGEGIILSMSKTIEENG